MLTIDSSKNRPGKNKKSDKNKSQYNKWIILSRQSAINNIKNLTPRSKKNRSPDFWKTQKTNEIFEIISKGYKSHVKAN